jgi:hypothetical protein
MEELQQLFRRQHGAATARQVRAAGVSLRRQAQLCRLGVWETAANGVIVAAGAPDSWSRRASIAVLGSRVHAGLSHGSAARLYGLDGYAAYTSLHVTVGHGARSGRGGATQHVLVGHGRKHVHTHDGIDAVTVPLAIIGCLVADGSDAAAKALDSALRSGMSPTWFLQVGEQWRSRGRRGPTQLVGMVIERTDAILPLSWFQRLAARALAELGMTMVDEHPVYSGGRLLARLDLADVTAMIGVECQSWRWHASPGAQRVDAARRRSLRRLGWEVVDVWWSDLGRMDDVVATIQAIRDERAGSIRLPDGPRSLDPSSG